MAHLKHSGEIRIPEKLNVDWCTHVASTKAQIHCTLLLTHAILFHPTVSNSKAIKWSAGVPSQFTPLSVRSIDRKKTHLKHPKNRGNHSGSIKIFPNGQSCWLNPNQMLICSTFSTGQWSYITHHLSNLPVFSKEILKNLRLFDDSKCPGPNEPPSVQRQKTPFISK